MEMNANNNHVNLEVNPSPGEPQMRPQLWPSREPRWIITELLVHWEVITVCCFKSVSLYNCCYTAGESEYRQGYSHFNNIYTGVHCFILVGSLSGNQYFYSVFTTQENNFPKFLKDINSQNQESSAIHKQDKYKGNHTYMVHSFWSEIFKVLKKRKISTQNLFKSSLNLLQYCFCFMFYFFWPGGMWDPSSLTTVQTWTPYIGRQSLNFLLPGKSYLRIFYITKLLFKKECKIKTFWNG